jgi:hypothetical protein
MTPPRLRVASDVGGTFTDNLAYDEAAKRITVAKLPTTPENRALGTVQGLRRALALQGRTGDDVAYVGHGMTTATNAVIQRRGGRIAFITNEGFRDLLLIGRQNRPSLYDIRRTRPEPLVAREDCHTVRGRLDPTGQEITPLDEDGLRHIAERLRADRVGAVAICLLHAYANPAHERRAKAILAEALPGIPVCISTDILAEFREYERASTVVLNAYLLPVMARYLASLTELLADPVAGLGLGPAVPVMVMEASGGLMTVATARDKPVHTVLSGPAGGVVASAHVAALSGFADIITLDMGGTSTDISLVLGGAPQVTREAGLAGAPIGIPIIDINAIGAGGGSIAWIDDGGALRVGPHSAEAVPGPACYGRGGDEPTVTDANLVLGRFGADTRLGGELALDPEAAARAIRDRIAGPLGLDQTAAAAGILRVANATMTRGIRVVSVERGHDPRRLTLVPFGGAGPMHGSPLARIGDPAPSGAADPRHPLRARHAGRRSAPRSGAHPSRRACRAPGRDGACRIRADAGGGAPAARRRPDAGRTAAHRDAGRHALYRAILRTADPAPRPHPPTASRRAPPSPASGGGSGWGLCSASVGRGRLGGAGWGLPCRACPPLRPQRPRGAGRAGQLRGHRDRADRHAGTAAPGRRRASAARGGAPWHAPSIFRDRRTGRRRVAGMPGMAARGVARRQPHRRAGDRRGGVGDDSALSWRPCRGRCRRQLDRRGRRLR